MSTKLLIKNVLAGNGITITGGGVTGDKVASNLLNPDTDLTYGSTTRVNIDFTTNQELDSIVTIHAASVTSSTRVTYVLQDASTPTRTTYLDQAYPATEKAIFTFLDNPIRGIRRFMIDPRNPTGYIIAGSAIVPSVPPLLGDGLTFPITNSPHFSPDSNVFILQGLPRRVGNLRWNSLTDSESDQMYDEIRYALEKRTPIAVSLFEGDSARQEMGRFPARIQRFTGPTKRRNNRWEINLSLVEVF